MELPQKADCYFALTTIDALASHWQNKSASHFKSFAAQEEIFQMWDKHVKKLRMAAAVG